MRYDLPTDIKKTNPIKWPVGIDGIPALLPDGRKTEVPVLEGVNVLTFGVTGTGKTRSYTLPAAKILLDFVPDMKGVFFEIKSSFIKQFFQPGDKVIVFDSPVVQKENLFSWCLIKEIRQAQNQEAEIRQIADFLFADMLSDANQNLGWVESARSTFAAVLRVIVECTAENTTNRTLIHALRRMTIRELLAYLARHPRNHSLLRKDFGYDIANPSGYEPTRRANDILFFFNQVLEKFGGSFESDGQDTIYNFLHTKNQNLFILYDLASAEISRPFILYFLKKIKDEKMSNASNIKSPILFCLDEADKMSDGGKAADFGLFQAATLGREYGLQILLTTQSMENLYGLAPEFNQHITNGGISGFPIVLSFRPGDTTTIETLQKLYGSIYSEHIVLPVSRYGHTDVKYELDSLVTDRDFAALDTGECYIKIKSCSPQKVRIIYNQNKGESQ